MVFADGYEVSSCKVLYPKAQQICLTKDVIFLSKSYGEWGMVEKPVVVLISYDGSDKEGVEMVT